MLTDAPDIRTLRTLTHAWRTVAIQTGPDTWKWYGDLGPLSERMIYAVMRDEHRSLIQAMYRLQDHRVVLFARIAAGKEPAAAYSDAVGWIGLRDARNDAARATNARGRMRRTRGI